MKKTRTKGTNKAGKQRKTGWERGGSSTMVTLVSPPPRDRKQEVDAFYDRIDAVLKRAIMRLKRKERMKK